MSLHGLRIVRLAGLLGVLAVLTGAAYFGGPVPVNSHGWSEFVGSGPGDPDCDTSLNLKTPACPTVDGSKTQCTLTYYQCNSQTGQNNRVCNHAGGPLRCGAQPKVCVPTNDDTANFSKCNGT